MKTYKTLTEKYLQFVHENDKEDILSGLNVLSQQSMLAGKTADVFTIHLSGELDYEADEIVPAQAIAMQWSELPDYFKKSKRFAPYLNTSPGLAYVADENGFDFYLVNDIMKKLGRDAMLLSYPVLASKLFLTALTKIQPYKDWVASVAGFENDGEE